MLTFWHGFVLGFLCAVVLGLVLVALRPHPAKPDPSPRLATETQPRVGSPSALPRAQEGPGAPRVPGQQRTELEPPARGGMPNALESVPKPVSKVSRKAEPGSGNSAGSVVKGTPEQAVQAKPHMSPRSSPNVGREGGVIRTRTGERTAGRPLQDRFARDGERCWTVDEQRILLDRYRDGATIPGLAVELSIDSKDVAARLVRLIFGVTGVIDNDDEAPNARKRYSAEEEAFLVDSCREGTPLGTMAATVGRSQLGVGWRLLSGHVPAVPEDISLTEW